MAELCKKFELHPTPDQRLEASTARRDEPPRILRKTREAVELATLNWVSWFNHHPLMEPLGHIPPAEAEANYYHQLSGQAT